MDKRSNLDKSTPEVLDAFLVVDDHELSCRTVARIVSRYRAIRLAGSFHEGLAEMRSRTRWCGFIFDLDAEKRTGFDLLRIARKEYPSTPAAIVTGYLDCDCVNTAAALGATIIGKGFNEGAIRPFLQRAIDLNLGICANLSEQIDECTRLYELTSREHEIIVWLLSGRSREEFLTYSGIAEGTFRYHVGHILEKVGSSRLDEAALKILSSIVMRRQHCASVQQDPAPVAALARNAQHVPA